MALFLFKRSRAEVRRATRARQAWERDAGREAHGMSENGPASRGISDTRETGAGRQCPLPFTERACRRRGDRSSAEERKRHVLLRYSVEASGPFFRKRHLRRAAMRGASFFLLPESPAARDAARKRDGCNRRSDGGHGFMRACGVSSGSGRDGTFFPRDSRRCAEGGATKRRERPPRHRWPLPGAVRGLRKGKRRLCLFSLLAAGSFEA